MFLCLCRLLILRQSMLPTPSISSEMSTLDAQGTSMGPELQLVVWLLIVKFGSLHGRSHPPEPPLTVMAAVSVKPPSSVVAVIVALPADMPVC